MSVTAQASQRQIRLGWMLCSAATWGHYCASWTQGNKTICTYPKAKYWHHALRSNLTRYRVHFWNYSSPPISISSSAVSHYTLMLNTQGGQPTPNQTSLRTKGGMVRVHTHGRALQDYIRLRLTMRPGEVEENRCTIQIWWFWNSKIKQCSHCGSSSPINKSEEAMTSWCCL